MGPPLLLLLLLLSLLVRQLGVHRPDRPLTPLIRLGIEGVPQSIVGVILKTHSCSWIPLGMLLCEAFLSIGPYLELLPLPQLYNQNVIILPVVIGILLPAP